MRLTLGLRGRNEIDGATHDSSPPPSLGVRAGRGGRSQGDTRQSDRTRLPRDLPVRVRRHGIPESEPDDLSGDFDTGRRGMRSRYWYFYSSLDFSAGILKRPESWEPPSGGGSPSECFYYYGPFDSLKECRAEVVAKIKGDINEYRQLLREVKGPPNG